MLFFLSPAAGNTSPAHRLEQASAIHSPAQGLEDALREFR